MLGRYSRVVPNLVRASSNSTEAVFANIILNKANEANAVDALSADFKKLNRHLDTKFDTKEYYQQMFDLDLSKIEEALTRMTQIQAGTYVKPVVEEVVSNKKKKDLGSEQIVFKPDEVAFEDEMDDAVWEAPENPDDVHPPLDQLSMEQRLDVLYQKTHLWPAKGQNLEELRAEYEFLKNNPMESPIESTFAHLKLHPFTLEVLTHLWAENHWEMLPSIIPIVQEEKLARRKEMGVHVRTAVELTPKQLQRLEKCVLKNYPEYKAVITQEVIPSLGAGFIAELSGPLNGRLGQTLESQEAMCRKQLEAAVREHLGLPPAVPLWEKVLISS